MISFKHILVPVDFGEPSDHALEVAMNLAKQYGSLVTLVHVWELPAYAYSGMELAPVDLLTPIQDAAREQLDKTVNMVKKSGVEVRGILKQGVPWREILSTINDSQPDLVVIGTHGRRGVKRALLGSVAEKVVRTSSAPVLTVRAETDAAAEIE